MNSTDFPSKEQLAHRFAGRLHAVLDKSGYPAMPLDRARALSAAIDQDVSTASTLLNGLLMPDWEVLIKICSFTKSQPGYFLDESPIQYPPETRVVKAQGTGENIILRVPTKKGSRWAPAAAAWSYVTARDDMGFGVISGDYLVNYSLSQQLPGVGVNNLYLLGVDNRYEIRQCSDVSNGRAVFIGSGNDSKAGVPRIFPLAKDHQLDEIAIEKSGVHYFGEISTVVRRSELLPRL